MQDSCTSEVRSVIMAPLDVALRWILLALVSSTTTATKTVPVIQQPDSYVAFCAIVKDQHLDLLEWLEWHKCE
jgi:hypothetical protein